MTLLPQLMVGSGAIEYLMETSFSANAQVVPETTLKPTTTLTYEQKLSKVATIASILKVSLQALADIPQLMIWLDARLLYAVLLRREAVILLGDSANGIQGLMDVAPAFDYTPVAGGRNLATLRGELRPGLAVPLPQGLLKGTLPAKK